MWRIVFLKKNFLHNIYTNNAHGNTKRRIDKKYQSSGWRHWKKLAIGSYTVKIIAPNGALYTKKSFKVTKMPTYIDCPNVKVKYGTTKYITVKVYRKLDNDWASGTVKFTINGKTYKAKLKQGEAKIKIKVPSKIKTYSCKVKFLENSKYKGSSKKFKLIVKKSVITKKKKPKSFTVVVPVKLNQYTSKTVGKYKVKLHKYITDFGSY